MTHFVLIVPLEVTTPWITFDPNVPSFVRMFSTAQFSTTLAPDLVENLDKAVHRPCGSIVPSLGEYKVP